MSFTSGRAHGPLTQRQADQLRRHLMMWRKPGTKVRIDGLTGRWEREEP